MKLRTHMARVGLAGLFTWVAVGASAQDVPAQQSEQSATSSQNATPVCPWARRMNAQVARMQAMHQAMAEARTPDERARLMNEQWQLMRQGMGMMRGAPYGGMGQGMGKGMGMGMHGNMHGSGAGSPSDVCMRERLGMMEVMMQSMKDRLPQDPSAHK